MELYNFDSLSWGFSMYLPKLKGYNKINIFCDVYLCHPDIDDKDMCDRSCSLDINKKPDLPHLFENETEPSTSEHESVDSKNETFENEKELSGEEYPELIMRRNVRSVGNLFRRMWENQFGMLLKKRSLRDMKEEKKSSN